MANKNADPIDSHIGAKLRQARVLAGLSQSQLGKSFGVSFQQIQKYESGANRVSAGGLVRLADILKMPLLYFYEGLSNIPPLKECALSLDNDILMQHYEQLELMRVYLRVPSEKRPKILKFLKLAIDETP